MTSNDTFVDFIWKSWVVHIRPTSVVHFTNMTPFWHVIEKIILLHKNTRSDIIHQKELNFRHNDYIYLQIAMKNIKFMTTRKITKILLKNKNFTLNRAHRSNNAKLSAVGSKMMFRWNIHLTIGTVVLPHQLL